MSVRWWRTIHPTVVTANAINLDSQMTMVLMFSLFVITLLYVYLLILRYRQLDLKSRLDRLRHQHLMR
jgi:heme exporter protein C